MSTGTGASGEVGRRPTRDSRWQSAADPATLTLTVWIYDSALGAIAGEVRLRNLRERSALRVHEASTVTWMPGTHRPRIGDLRHQTSAAAARGSVLAGLLDVIFRPPAAGVPEEARLAALAERLGGTGIDRTLLWDVKANLHPDSSELVVLSSGVDLDEVRPAIERGLARGDVVLRHALLRADALRVIREVLHDLSRHGSGE